MIHPLENSHLRTSQCAIRPRYLACFKLQIKSVSFNQCHLFVSKIRFLGVCGQIQFLKVYFQIGYFSPKESQVFISQAHFQLRIDSNLPDSHTQEV